MELAAQGLTMGATVEVHARGRGGSRTAEAAEVVDVDEDAEAAQQQRKAKFNGGARVLEVLFEIWRALDINSKPHAACGLKYGTHFDVAPIDWEHSVYACVNFLRTVVAMVKRFLPNRVEWTTPTCKLVNACRDLSESLRHFADCAPEYVESEEWTGHYVKTVLDAVVDPMRVNEQLLKKMRDARKIPTPAERIPVMRATDKSVRGSSRLRPASPMSSIDAAPNTSHRSTSSWATPATRASGTRRPRRSSGPRAERRRRRAPPPRSAAAGASCRRRTPE